MHRPLQRHHRRGDRQRRGLQPDLGGAQAGRDQARARPVRDRPGARQENPLGRGPQPLQTHRLADGDRRRRAAEVQHPADRPDRRRQDAARADARALPAGAVHDRRRDLADRGRLRRRRRREHHPVAAAERRLRHRALPARHRLHRRDRQDRAQGRQPLDHARRLGRRRAAGAAQDHRGHDGERAAQGRPQASAAGIPAGRHDQHPVHLRRRVRRPRRHHPPAHRGQDDGLSRRPDAIAIPRRSPSCSTKCSPRTCSSSD